MDKKRKFLPFSTFNQDEIVSKLKTKNKLLGNVLGKLVFSQLDDEPLAKPDYFHNINDLWSDFTAFFYTKGLREKMAKGPFFKEALEKMWKRNPNKFCKAGQSTEECHNDKWVDTLASVMYHTEGSDKSWMPTKEDFGK